MTHEEIHVSYFGNVSKCLHNAPHDEEFLRNIEKRIEVLEQDADDFRRAYSAFISGIGVDVDWDYDPPVLTDYFNRVKWDSHP